mmetsp:Transcript_49987/g.165522  ORF Transcript_49987/g.165522 Transcript_49987/m.165522 type:complete len:334 (+) Transcript_49987:1117-2118(+)
MDRPLGVPLGEGAPRAALVLLLLDEPALVVLRPAAERQLEHLDPLRRHLDPAHRLEAASLPEGHKGAGEAARPRTEGRRRLAAEHCGARIEHREGVVRPHLRGRARLHRGRGRARRARRGPPGGLHAYRRGPPGADARRAVDEQERQQRRKVLRLDLLSVLDARLEHGRVGLREEERHHGREAREDVPRRGCVRAAHRPRAELAERLEQRHVCGADEALCHLGDGRDERRLAVVVLRHVGHEGSELRHLELGRRSQPPLEARVQHLALRRLEPVDERRQGAAQRGEREEHQVALHKLLEGAAAAKRRLRGGHAAGRLHRLDKLPLGARERRHS